MPDSETMPEILTLSPNQEVPKDTFWGKIKNLWEAFSSKDTFTKTSLIVMTLILLIAPAIIAQKTNLFSHASTSLFNNCTPIPSGLTQEQIQQLSQSGKVRWCNTSTKQRWFAPNYMPLWFHHNYADPSWDSYFTDPSVLDSSLSQTDVIQLWPDAITHEDSHHWFENLLPSIQSHHVKISINAGYIGNTDQYSSKSCSGAITAAHDITSYLQPIYAKGAVIDYIVMDGFPINLLQAPCNYSVAKAVPELVAYMQTIHKSYPAIQIGLDVNFPNWAYNGTPSYWGTTAPLSDYKPIFDQMVSQTTAVGEHIAFLQVDNPYDYAVGIHVSQFANVHSIDWTLRILQLEKQVKSYGIPFGILYNSEFAGKGVDGKGGDDALFYYDTLNYIDYYKSRGGNPDQIAVMSWYPNHPSSLLPASQLFTYTNLYNAAVGTRPTTTIKPVYQLFNAKGQNFYTIYPGEKNDVVTKYGYTLQGIGFYAQSTNLSGTVPVIRLTYYSGNNNGSRIYTISQSEITNALRNGWHSDGTVFYAYSTQAANTIPVYKFNNDLGGYCYGTSVSACHVSKPIIYDMTIPGNRPTVAFYVPISPSSPTPILTSIPSSTPTPTAIPFVSKILGYFDSASCQNLQLTGWACDRNIPSTPLTINFYIDGPIGVGTLISSTIANGQREATVKNLCLGNANHGFVSSLPASIRDGKAHTIYAYALGAIPGEESFLLVGSPKTRVCR